jgi:dolichol-phosphate mannosyltransferase
LKLLVVIPTFNEAENIQPMLSALLLLPIEDLHILIVDDNSPDGTGEIVEKLKQENSSRIAILNRTGKLGLGSAYITGFQYGLANGYDFISQMDADFSHPPEKLVELLAVVQNDIDLAIGSRYIKGGSLDKDWPLWRKFLSGFGNFYARSILNLPVKDVTGGFRVWNRKLLERMSLDKIRSNGYVFQVEMLYVACRVGCKYQEIPFYFADRKIGKSKMSFKIQAEAAINVWRLPGYHKGI